MNSRVRCPSSVTTQKYLRIGFWSPDKSTTCRFIAVVAVRKPHDPARLLAVSTDSAPGAVDWGEADASTRVTCQIPT